MQRLGSAEGGAITSEFRPSSPIQRPETARSRTDAEPEIDPPTHDELEAIERHLASLPAHSGATVEPAPDLGVLLVSAEGRGPGFNYAAQPRWSPAGWRLSLDRLVGTFEGSGAWPSLLVADRLDRPIGLEKQLTGLGWSPVARETVLWVGRASVVPHLDPSLRIEAVQPRALAEHEAVERRIFGLHEREAAERRESLAAALATGRLRAYLVRIGDEPVAVARLSQGDGVAGLYGIGVVPERRRQGIGTLITTVATRAGLALGNRLVWLSVDEGNDAASRVYERLGFAPAFSWARWLRAPS